MKVPRVIALPNGLRLVLAPRADAPTATALITVRAGSEYEAKEENGVSHFLEHLAFKGTARYPKPGQLAHELEGMGADTNAWTSEMSTSYYAKAQAGKADRLLEIVAELHLSPLLDAAEIERERGVVIEEIAMYEDMPSRRVHDLWSELLYGDQPAGRPVAGPKETVRRLTRAQIAGYRARRYRAPETVVSLAGGFDAARAARFVRERFGQLDARGAARKPRTREAQSAPALRLQKKASDQAHLVIGFRAFPIGHPSEPALSMLAAILGSGMSSRLFMRIREELGAAYYVNAWLDESADHGALGVSVGAGVDRVEEVTGAVLAEFGRLTDALVSPRELRRARDYRIGGLLMGLESSDAIAARHAADLMFRGRIVPVREEIGNMRAVTPEDIRRAARRVIRPEGLNLAAIGPDVREAHFRKLLRLG